MESFISLTEAAKILNVSWDRAKEILAEQGVKTIKTRSSYVIDREAVKELVGKCGGGTFEFPVEEEEPEKKFDKNNPVFMLLHLDADRIGFFFFGKKIPINYGEKAVLVYVFSNYKTDRNKNYYFEGPYKEIAAGVGMAEKSIRNYIISLCEKGFLEKEKNRGRNEPNKFWIACLNIGNERQKELDFTGKKEEVAEKKAPVFPVDFNNNIYFHV